MKQILIKKTDSIYMESGNKFYLHVNDKILPMNVLASKALVTVDFPLEMEVLSGGNGFELVFKPLLEATMNGIAMLGASQMKGKVRATFMNLTDTDLYLEDGLPLIEVSLVQAVSFKQVESEFIAPNGTIMSNVGGVVEIKPMEETRKADTQVRKARKKK